MTIGRLSFGIDKNFLFYAEKAACGCCLASFGFLWFLWSSLDCKCGACGKHVCKCEEK